MMISEVRVDQARSSRITVKLLYNSRFYPWISILKIRAISKNLESKTTNGTNNYQHIVNNQFPL